MKIIKGDLLKLADEGQFDIIIHGCNCYCTFGAGIAQTISRKYPAAFEADKKTEYGSKDKLGTYSYAKALTKTNPVKTFIIINAYTQHTCWNTPEKSNDLFEYEAFQSILDQLLGFRFGDNHYGFPLIGCGLAGGDKQRILGMIEEFSRRIEHIGGSVTVVEFG